MAPLRDLPGRSSKPSSDRAKSKHHQAEVPFVTTKKDKQLIKHSRFISKINKSSASSKKSRNRRANKKLVTGLDEIVQALPTSGDQPAEPNGSPKYKLQGQVQIIKQKSLKSRPGALKRKENLEKRERGRFTKNMAQMVVAPQSRQEHDANTDEEHTAQDRSCTTSSAEKFSALRDFISQTMERRPGSEKATS